MQSNSVRRPRIWSSRYFFLLTNPFYPIVRYIPGTASRGIRKSLECLQVITDRVAASEIDLQKRLRLSRWDSRPQLMACRLWWECSQNGPVWPTRELDMARRFLQRTDRTMEIFNWSRRPSAVGGLVAGRLRWWETSSMRYWGNIPSCPVLVECAQTTLISSLRMMWCNTLLLQRKVPEPEEIRPKQWDALPKNQPFLNTFQNGPHMCPGKPPSLLEEWVFFFRWRWNLSSCSPKEWVVWSIWMSYWWGPRIACICWWSEDKRQL